MSKPRNAPTQGKGRRPIIGYDNTKFRANYDEIFKKKEKCEKTRQPSHEIRKSSSD
jgi:hypothetical protein